MGEKSVDLDSTDNASSLQATLNQQFDLGAREFIVTQTSDPKAFAISFSQPPAFTSVAGTTFNGSLLTLNRAPTNSDWRINFNGSEIPLTGTGSEVPSAEQIQTILNSQSAVSDWGGVVVLDALTKAPTLATTNEELATLVDGKLTVLAKSGNYTLSLNDSVVSLGYNASGETIATALKTKRAETLGVTLADLRESFDVEEVYGAEPTLTTAGITTANATYADGTLIITGSSTFKVKLAGKILEITANATAEQIQARLNQEVIGIGTYIVSSGQSAGEFKIEFAGQIVNYIISFIGALIPDTYDIQFAAAPVLALENPAEPRPINYADLDSLRIEFSAVSDLDLDLDATGSISTSDNFLIFDGAFGVNIDSYDIFDRSAPLLFDITFSGSLTVDNYFLISGELSFSRQQGPLTFSDGRVVDDAVYSLISGNNIDVFAGYLDPDADVFADKTGTRDDGDSQGIRIEDIGFTLLTYDDAVGVDASGEIFRALKSTGGSAELVGVEELRWPSPISAWRSTHPRLQTVRLFSTSTQEAARTAAKCSRPSSMTRHRVPQKRSTSTSKVIKASSSALQGP